MLYSGGKEIRFAMEVNFSPELQAKIEKLVSETGCTVDDLAAYAFDGYLAQLPEVRETLDSRYDDMKSGRVKLIPGDEVFAALRAKSALRRAQQA